uniref:Endoplasmic reticulum membrane sensor NFE2L1 n=1 Tax=Salarias fasciatus TaxID=181472 RepID=A0A672H957_SALFA
MLYLKKYFTEGLIQFTILLSLIGVRVDVDTYLSNQLPPLREIILGPSSAYTQTQFHNLRNTLDGYGIHPKSVDLDHFFTTRRLLNQVRQLDRLSVPSTELNTWLVHRDSETVVSASSQSSPSITLDNGAGLEDVDNPDATPRGGEAQPAGQQGGQRGAGELEEWHQPPGIGAGGRGDRREHPGAGWSGRQRSPALSGELGVSECGADQDQNLFPDVTSVSFSVPKAMEVNSTAPLPGSAAGTPESGAAGQFGLPARPTPINQDVSLHQASLPSCSQDFPPPFNPQLDSAGAPQRAPLLRPPSGNSSNVNSTFGATNLTGIFLPPHVNGSASNATAAAAVLADPFGSLLEEAMLDEISLLDLAMEEGFSQAQASQLEDELDSDSGLSLDSSRSPASPSSSETSCSSEGAVGYSTDSEVAAAEPEEGAVGGYQPGYSKLCRMSFQDPTQFHGLPQLDGVGHNHTYNLPLASAFPERPELPLAAGKKAARDKQGAKFQPPQDFLDKHSSRDERRARAMKIPFSNDKIINLPVEEFNELLAKHHLSEAQLALIRDIRRRGKNKLAAQNCRKRKLDTIINLEQGVQDLRRDKARLLKEKMEFLRSIRQMKQKMQSLYQEVFAQLRDEEGRPYPPSQYSLQYGADGSVLVTPRGAAAAEQGRKPEKKQKDKKK